MKFLIFIARHPCKSPPFLNRSPFKNGLSLKAQFNTGYKITMVINAQGGEVVVV